MIGTYRMLTNRKYVGKDGGERTAYNLEVSIDGVGTGDLYIRSKELHDQIEAQGFEDGDRVRLLFTARKWNGNLTPEFAGVEAI